MVQYYWNPNYQRAGYFPQMNVQQMPANVAPPPLPAQSGTGIPASFPTGERSYIENILRLNIGKPGTFYFSFADVAGETENTRVIVGNVKAAGRDHVIVTESRTGHDFLFPMIYFDYAEFDEPIEYFPQTIGTREV